MKLYSNTDNSSALKILISSNFSRKTVEVCTVTTEDARFNKPQCRLPVLEADTGERIFSTNSASYFLFPPKSVHEQEINCWLEWEAVQLQGLLVRSIGTKFDSEQLLQLFGQLSSVLGKQDFLIKGVNEVTVADISIWCTLYPLLTDSKLANDLFSNKFDHMVKWFKKLQQLSQFKDAVDKLKCSEGIQCLNNISTCTWYPAPVASTTQKLGRSVSQQSSNSTADVSSGITKESVTDVELKAAEEAWNTTCNVKAKKKIVPVLPVPGERNVLVTSALPYVNNVPHLGNIIGCVLSADVFARYSRLRNWNTLYISGVDEYGTATETKALQEGLTPKQICDKYYAIHKEIYEWFNIEFDYFGRTTSQQQTEIVQELFNEVHKNQFTSIEAMEQLLCEKCDRYLADRFVEGVCPRCSYDDARGDQCDGCGHLINATELIKPRCKLCQNTPVVRFSDQIFIELTKLEENVRSWLEGVCDGWSHNAKVIAKSWLKDGLKPRCITRDLKWGIPVPLPGFEQKVFYVWFDAPIGYLSMTKCYLDDWRIWWHASDKLNVTLYQFMAKDNVPFHSIVFPSSLIAAANGSDKKYNMVKHLMATEYLNYEDGKFSKSRGVGVFGTDARETGISSDVFRFYLLYVRPENQDTSFSWTDLATKNNTELLNNLGNFINRALVFVEKFFNGVVPDMKMSNEDYLLLVYITREIERYVSTLDKAKLRDGIRHILAISAHGNQYMQSAQPWVLVKGNQQDKDKAGTVVGLCSNISCLLAVMLKPYMPNTSDVILKQLNLPPSNLFVLQSQFHMLLKPGHKIGKPAPLFTKIEQTVVDDLKKRFSGTQQQLQKESNKSNKSNKSDKNTAKQPSNNNKKSVLNVVPSSNLCVSNLEEAIAKQGDLVRGMKSQKLPKSDWQPHVEVLLEMKKQLAELKANIPSVTELQEKVSKQGDLVRQMKASGIPKPEWQPQVNLLLELKKQLAAAQQ